MIGAIRWLKGYVKIKVWGYAPERFMNLCTNRGIALWKVAGYGGYYELYMGLSDFFTIREIARKTKTRVAVLERCGLPFFWKDVRRRKMFLTGLIACLIFLLFMSRFLWSVEFVGNQQITDEMLMDFLAAQGVDYGSKKSALDLEKLEDTLREQFSQITWVSVRLDGTKITVQIKENDLPKKEEQLTEAEGWEDGADLVAAKAGTVVEILTRSGVPQVKIGDTAEKGDILVSGQVPVYNDDGTVREWQTCVSDADILIQYEQPVQLGQPFSYAYKNYTGKEEEAAFLILGQKRYRLPPGSCDFIKYDEVIEQKQLRLFSQIDLPLFYGTVRYREYLPVEAVYDENSAKECLQNSFLKIVEGLEQKGVQIIQKDVKIVRKTDMLSLIGTLTVQEEAVLLKPAALTEQPERFKNGES